MNNDSKEILYLRKVFDPIGTTKRFLKDPLGSIQRNIDYSVDEALTHDLEPPQKAVLYDEETPEGREVEVGSVWYIDGIEPHCMLDNEATITDPLYSKIVFDDPTLQSDFMED